MLEKPPKYQTQPIDHDGLWKSVISEMFSEFFLFFAPNLWEQVDFSKEPKFLQQELFQIVTDKKKGRRIADQIVKVKLKNGKEEWILVHIEVQGESEPDFPERMFQYFYRIYDRYKQKIVAIAVITTPTTSATTQSFHYSSFGTTLQYEYKNCKIFDYNEKELDQIMSLAKSY